MQFITHQLQISWVLVVCMKLLLVTIEFPPETGGIENYTYNIVKRIPGSIVLAPEVPGVKDFDSAQDFKIIRKKILYHRQHWLLKNKFYSNSLGYIITVISLILRSWKAINEEKPDVILCSDSIPVGLVIGFLNKINKIPYVVFSYGKDILFLQHVPFIKLLLHNSFKNASKVIVISEYTRNLVMQLDIPESKTYKINPCVDSGFFKPLDVSDLIKQHGISDKKILLSVGRLVERKGVDTVISSLPEVVKKIPNLIYLIAGNGPYNNYLKQLVSSLDLEKHVRFIGYVPDEQLPEYYNLCDAFIMPSRTEKGDPEGFGIVFLEAGACGKPVIGSRMGGIPDAVLDGKTGMLVDPLDEREIADAILELLNDENKARKIGECGRRRAEQLNWEAAADKLKHIISNL